MRLAVGLAGLCILAMLAGCGAATGEDEQVTTRGSAEVTATLLEIPEEFPPNDLYDYAYVMKYKVDQVHRGEVDGDTIYVAHYNPLRDRGRVTDDRVTDIGGNLREFKVGDTHRMALEKPIDDYYMGPIINHYDAEKPDPIYWAVWTNSAG